MNYDSLNYWDIALAASLVCINAGLSIYYKLGTAKRLVIAVIRMVVQLTLVGLVLSFIHGYVAMAYLARSCGDGWVCWSRIDGASGSDVYWVLGVWARHDIDADGRRDRDRLCALDAISCGPLV